MAAMSRSLQACVVLAISAILSSSSELPAANQKLSGEKRLIKNLVDTYKQVGLVGRPVKNSSDPITVSYGLDLVQILDVDEKNQVLTINAWNRFQWVDYLLSWNPNDYDGITSVRIPPDDIWKPDLVLYNYADGRLDVFRHAYAVITHDGTVTWIPSSIYKSSCSIDIANFPFDSQTCELKFSSWTYDGSKLDLAFFRDKPEVSITNYVPSNEWDLIEHPARKNIRYYTCCEEPFPDLTFTLKIKRQVAFYSYILLLPCILLSLLTMTLFWIPPESAAKMQMGMSIFLAFFLLLLLLSENTPPAATNIPLIGAFFCLNMVMITLSTFMAVIIIHLYFRGPRTNRLPPCVKKFVFGRLAHLLMMDSYAVEFQEEPNSTDLRLAKTYKCRRVQELSYNKFQAVQGLAHALDAARDELSPALEKLSDGSGKRWTNSDSVDPSADGTSPDVSPLHLYRGLEADMREVRRSVEFLASRQKTQDQLEKIHGEWRAMALVLDRAFFILYTVSIVISLAVMFPKGE